MPRFASLAVALMALSSLSATSASAARDEQTRERKVRAIQINGTLISDLLRPDDDIVEARSPSDGGMVLDDLDSQKELVELLAHSPFSNVAIVHVTGVTSLLGDEGTAVHTQFVGRVEEVLRSGAELTPVERVSKDQVVEFVAGGGEVAIRGVIVRVAPVVDYPYPARYLVVLSEKRHENGWGCSLSSPLLLRGDTAVAVAPEKSLLDGLTLDQVRRALKPAR